MGKKYFFFRTVRPLPTFYINKKVSHFEEKKGPKPYNAQLIRRNCAKTTTTTL